MIPILETCGGHEVDMVNCGTCGVLITDTITPNVFLLEDGPVTIPGTVLATTSIKSSFSELEELKDKIRTNYSPPSFIKIKDELKDTISDADKQFN